MFRTVSRHRLRDLQPAELIDQDVNAGDFFGVTTEEHQSIWHYDGRHARRVGVANFDPIPVSISLRDAMSLVPPHSVSPFVIHRMTLSPGAFYPRIARPNDQHPLETPGDNPDWVTMTEVRVAALSQIRSLVSMLDTVFQAVHPAVDNLSSYGISVRNLLILACTECEAQWRGVLKANGYNENRPTTKDFVKLMPAMRLGEYSIRLPLYPALGPIAPFQDWNPVRATKSLGWYDDYNAVKHDREREFHKASIGTAVQAVAACWIMLAAQFGIHAMRQFPDLRDYFEIIEGPRWRHSDVYTFAYDGHDEGKGPVHYPF